MFLPEIRFCDLDFGNIRPTGCLRPIRISIKPLEVINTFDIKKANT